MTTILKEALLDIVKNFVQHESKTNLIHSHFMFEMFVIQTRDMLQQKYAWSSATAERLVRMVGSGLLSELRKLDRSNRKMNIKEKSIEQTAIDEFVRCGCWFYSVAKFNYYTHGGADIFLNSFPRMNAEREWLNEHYQGLIGHWNFALDSGILNLRTIDEIGSGPAFCN